MTRVLVREYSLEFGSHEMTTDPLPPGFLLTLTIWAQFEFFRDAVHFSRLQSRTTVTLPPAAATESMSMFALISGACSTTHELSAAAQSRHNKTIFRTILCLFSVSDSPFCQAYTQPWRQLYGYPPKASRKALQALLRHTATLPKAE